MTLCYVLTYLSSITFSDFCIEDEKVKSTAAEAIPVDETSPEAKDDPLPEQVTAKDDGTTDGGGETAGETSEDERPITATLRKTSGSRQVDDQINLRKMF